MPNTNPTSSLLQSTVPPEVAAKEPSSEENPTYAPTAAASAPPVDDIAPSAHDMPGGIVATISSDSDAMVSAPNNRAMAPGGMISAPVVHRPASLPSTQTTITETAAVTSRTRTMPESLSTTEVQEIVTNRIQQCISGCSASFSCGSSTVLPFAPSVTLLGEDGSAMGEPILLHRPAIGGNNRKDIFKKQETQLEHLMSTMPRAAFGKGGDTVIDTSVRDALQLDATKFALNIPQETIQNILANLKVKLDLQTDVVAEQYSLNLYRTGGMFKKHKDTPRGDDMLGTLVICLPTLFEGGCMKVTHGREVNKYFQRYSLPHCSHGSAEAVDNRIEWCAFFSDVDHEILTVKEGIRVTAAYILRRKDNAPASECIPRSLEGQEQADRVRDSFLLGLRDDRFLSNGGKIGCACIHQYTNQQVFPGNKDSSQPLDAGQIRKLKAKDLLIASAAVSAGLSVRLVPHLGHCYSCDGEGDFPLKKFPKKKKCPKKMSDDSISDFFDATQGAGQLQNAVDIWITDMDEAASAPAGSTEWNAEGYFGNEASDIAFYVNACFVIEIPSYSESRGVSNVAPIEVDAKPKAKVKKRKSEDSEDSQIEVDAKPKAKVKKNKSGDSKIEVDAKPKAKVKKNKSEDSNESTKKKKEKIAKDPNAPKRNMSAYIHYCNGNREHIMASRPNLNFGEITKVVSANWKALSSWERAIWDAKAAADKQRYQKDLADYKDSDQYAKWQASQMEESKPASSDSTSVDNIKKKKPKRNVAAFMHYSKGTRDDVKANQPDLSFGEIAKALSVNWKALTDQERAVWEGKAAADKVRYQNELAEYQSFEATVQDIVDAKMPAKEK